MHLQVVAAVQGRLLSIYDGNTEYKLGQTLHARRGGASWAPLDACYYAYPSMQQVSVMARGLDSIYMRSTQLASMHGLGIHKLCIGEGICLLFEQVDQLQCFDARHVAALCVHSPSYAIWAFWLHDHICIPCAAAHWCTPSVHH